jgi:hypothetical protein
MSEEVLEVSPAASARSKKSGSGRQLVVSIFHKKYLLALEE